jgi:hypothetical protein
MPLNGNATSGNAIANNPLGTNSQRVLTIGGLLLIAGGMLFGEIFAIFILHPNNARIGEAMYAASQLIPQGDVEGIFGHFQAIGGFLENRGTKVDAHSHGIHVGYIALLLAALQPWVNFSEDGKRRAAWFFVACGLGLPVSIFLIHYVGLAYSPVEHIGWASIMADLFGALLSLAVFLQFLGLWRHARSGERLDTGQGPGGGEQASRLLLAGGLLLLVWGFLYGAFYAAWLESGKAIPEVDILKSIVTNAASQNQELLGQDFAAYGKFQMYRAINVATHTHINEMGILLLLLSFAQRLLPYSDSARTRWAILAVAGGFLLPVGILLEIPYGVVGSVIADSAGFAVIASLVAMLLGLLRHIRSAGEGAP